MNTETYPLVTEALARADLFNNFGNHRADGLARIVVIVGGSPQRLASSPAVANANVVLYFDVEKELKVARPAKRVCCVALAPGETLGTLAQRYGTADEIKALNALPGVTLFDGLGQLRAVGKMAAKKLLADPEFHRLLIEQVLNPILVELNGRVLHVEIVVFSSNAGGTGGPCGPEIGSAIAKLFLDRTSASVEHHLLRIGSLSYVGVGERLHINTAVSTAGDVVRVTSSKRHPRESRRLTLVEVPMVGNQKAERDAYVIQLTQALRASRVLDLVQRPASNTALNSILGAITIGRCSFWNGLGDRQVAFDVAGVFIPGLQHLAATNPNHSRVLKVDVLAKTEINPDAKSLDQLATIVSEANGVRPEDFVTTCTTTPHIHPAGSVIVTFLGSETINLSEDLRAWFSKPALTEEALRHKIGDLRAIDARTQHEIDTRIRAVEELTPRRIGALADLERVLKKLFPKSFVGSVINGISSRAKLLGDFQNAVVACREIAEESRRLDDEIQFLRSIQSEIHRELETELGRLEAMLTMLRQFRPSDVSPGSPRVEVTPLDAVLPVLLALSQNASTEDLLRILGGCAQRVTLAGLAEIMRAPEATPASIAHRLAMCPPPIIAPEWGGKSRMGNGRSIIVLPPLPDNVERTVQEAVSVFDGDLVVVGADSAQGGANVVKLEFHEAKTTEDIFPPHYANALKEAEATILNGVETAVLAELAHLPSAETYLSNLT